MVDDYFLSVLFSWTIVIESFTWSKSLDFILVYECMKKEKKHHYGLKREEWKSEIKRVPDWQRQRIHHRQRKWRACRWKLRAPLAQNDLQNDLQRGCVVNTTLEGGLNSFQEMKYQGTVKWFSNKKGFGFIAPTSDNAPTKDEIFVHQTAIVTDGAYRTLKVRRPLESCLWRFLLFFV